MIDRSYYTKSKYEELKISLGQVFEFLNLCLKFIIPNKTLNKKTYSDPNSTEVQIILYLYSIEPSFCADLNMACRSLDRTRVKSLGPFARAFDGVM